MNIFITIAMTYAALLLLLQFSYFGLVFSIQALDYIKKHKPLFFIVTMGVLLTLFLFH